MYTVIATSCSQHCSIQDELPAMSRGLLSHHREVRVLDVQQVAHPRLNSASYMSLLQMCTLNSHSIFQSSDQRYTFFAAPANNVPSLFEQNGRPNLAEHIQFLQFLLIQLCGGSVTNYFRVNPIQRKSRLTPQPMVLALCIRRRQDSPGTMASTLKVVIQGEVLLYTHTAT